MHPRLSQSHVKLVTSFSLAILAAGIVPASGDDTGILGRLFRLGGGSSDSSPSTRAPSQPRLAAVRARPRTRRWHAPARGMQSLFAAADGVELQRLAADPRHDSARSPMDRRSGWPRGRAVGPAVTTADPVLTRFALGRSNDGSQFGMFLQVFADGTVIDSEGVHHLRAADLRPIVEAVQSGELYRVRGPLRSCLRPISSSMSTS